MMIKLNEILQEFFGHIQFMEINKDERALDENKIEQGGIYIELVKKTAVENLILIELKRNELISAILAQEKEFREGNKGSQSDYSSRGLYH